MSVGIGGGCTVGGEADGGVVACGWSRGEAGLGEV